MRYAIALLAFAACTRAEVAPEASPAPVAAATPVAAPASPPTLDVLLTADVWGEYGPCG